VSVSAYLARSDSYLPAPPSCIHAAPRSTRPAGMPDHTVAARAGLRPPRRAGVPAISCSLGFLPVIRAVELHPYCSPELQASRRARPRAATRQSRSTAKTPPNGPPAPRRAGVPAISATTGFQLSYPCRPSCTTASPPGVPRPWARRPPSDHPRTIPRDRKRSRSSGPPATMLLPAPDLAGADL
jgi:hypothetical protein